LQSKKRRALDNWKVEVTRSFIKGKMGKWTDQGAIPARGRG